jgi:polar amino acid transport system substrate-binding protein
MRQPFGLVVLLAIVALLVGGCGQPPTTGDDTPAAPSAVPTEADASSDLPDLGGRVLTVGTNASYPPMEFVDDESGEIVGFDIDLMNEIAARLNAEAEFEDFPTFDAIFAALAGGDFDLVVSGVSITTERDAIIDFSEPYLTVGQVVVVQAGNDAITGIDTLADAELVGVQGGTTAEQAILDAGVTEEQIRRYDTIGLAFQDLASGEVDAVVADGPTAAVFAEQFAGSIRVAGEPFTAENYGIALREGDDELTAALNAALAELKADGTLATLLQEWNLQAVAELP